MAEAQDVERRRHGGLEQDRPSPTDGAPSGAATEQDESNNGQSQDSGHENDQNGNGDTEKKSRPILWIVAAILIVLGLFFGIRFWLWNRHHVSTDDAYVTGDLVNVSPLISGTLIQVNVKEGDQVKQGQLLARLDPSGPEASLRQAQANYQAALTQVPQAERNLLYQQETTQADIQKAQAALASQRAKTNGAQQQVTLAAETVGHQINQARAQVDASVARARQAQVQIVSAQSALANYRSQVASARDAAAAAHAKVASARAEADRAARDADRYRVLYSQDAIAAQVLDKAQADAQDLADQVITAQQQAAQADALVTTAEDAVAQASDQVSVMRESYKAAQEDVGVSRAGLGLAQANSTQIGIQEAGLLSTRSQTGESQADIASAKAGEHQVAAKEKQIQTYRAQALEAQAAVTNAKITLDDTYIYAPCDGSVVRKDSNEGATMAPGTTIVTMTQGHVPLWIEANFKETQLAGVRTGQPVEVDVDAFPGKQFKGRVQSILSATGASTALLPPDNATGNFTKVVQRIQVRIQLIPAGSGDDPKYASLDDIQNLRLGMSVTATIDTTISDENRNAATGEGGPIPAQGPPSSPNATSESTSQPMPGNGAGAPPTTSDSRQPGGPQPVTPPAQPGGQSPSPVPNPGTGPASSASGQTGSPSTTESPAPTSPSPTGPGSGQSSSQLPPPVAGATGSTAGNAATSASTGAGH